MSDGIGCWVVVFLFWLLINGADAAWLYFYVQACVDPNPRTAVNKTHSGFEGYEAMMFFFGFVWGAVNLGVAWLYYIWLFSSDRSSKRGAIWTTLNVLINLFIVFPIWVFLVIMPFFGGWILVPLAQNWAWNHRCDPYPMYAVLDGKGYYDPGYVANVVHFYQTGSADSLFTYDIANINDAGDVWQFNLREWDQDQGAIPVDFYPTMQQLSYDFIHDSVTANCTVPVAPGSSNTTTIPCTTGTFNPNNFLSFNITSNVPLNNTANPTSVSSSTTLLRTIDKQWAFSDDAPSLILETVDPFTNNLQKNIVLRTAVTKKGDCTQLKVCMAGVPGREGSAVSAEVLVPVGLIMLRQADYAGECTAPSDSGD